MGILLRLAASAVAVWVATLILPGITVKAETTAGTIGTFVAVALIFGIVNAVLRPIIKFVGCAFYVLTLGLVALVVNGALLLLTSWLAGLLDLPFKVANFWPSAILGALIIGLASWVINLFIKIRPKSRPRPTPPPPPPPPVGRPPQYGPNQYPPNQDPYRR